MPLLPRYPALERAIRANMARYSRTLYLAILAALGESWTGRV